MKSFLKKILLSTIIINSYLYSEAKGNLVIIGGGSRPDYIMSKIVDFAGGKNAKIMIIPNASSEELDVAIHQKKEFEKSKPKSVDYIIFNNKDADKYLNKMNGVTGVFFSGGDQTKLIKSLEKTKLFDKIKEIYNKGGVISGTSAGAAVMSNVMITGEEISTKKAEGDFLSIKDNNVKTSQGFGFVTKAIIDQHFIKRKRQNRLISLSIENPNLPCIGIDESTAIIVKDDDTFEVLGESNVMIFDSSKTKNINKDKYGNFSVENLIIHLLQSGQKYDLNKKEIVF
ncbi:MAG: cyanophycinase [Candidatus Sericytochromatia bacterium]